MSRTGPALSANTIAQNPVGNLFDASQPPLAEVADFPVREQARARLIVARIRVGTAGRGLAMEVPRANADTRGPTRGSRWVRLATSEELCLEPPKENGAFAARS